MVPRNRPQQFNPPSIIHREDVRVRVNATEAEILLAIAAVWNQMAADAMAGRRKPPKDHFGKSGRVTSDESPEVP